MAASEVHAVVRRFLDRINAHDVDGICRLVTVDHLFVDALAQSVRGRERLRAGWKAYFDLFPDYRVTADRFTERGNVVGVFGSAEATCRVNSRLLPRNHWKIPAAWQAVVRRGRIAEWRVFCDNQPARRILGWEPP